MAAPGATPRAAPRLLAPVLLVLLAAARPSLAKDADGAPADAPPMRGEIETASLAAPAPPLRWAANVAADESGGVRLSLTRGALDMGMRFEPRLAAARPIDARYDSAAPAGATLPSLSLGLRSFASSPATAGSLVERALDSHNSPDVDKKIGIEWKPARSHVFVNRGVGFRLGGEDRIVMRLKKSSIGIYMQRKF
ncbi:MAG: hypothetical protein ACXWUL_00515 [Caldimonas sp.]